MEIGGDSAALVVGCLERADEQRFALLLASLEPLGQAPRQGNLDEPEQEETGEQQPGEREPDPAAGGRHRLASLVRLVEERCAVGHADREVDLVQVP